MSATTGGNLGELAAVFLKLGTVAFGGPPGDTDRKGITMSDSLHGGTFTASIFRYPGKGGWHFVVVPTQLAPPVTHGWGRTPVTAMVDGVEWETSVWRGKDGRTLLAIPTNLRGKKGDGDRVRVGVRFSL